MIVNPGADIAGAETGQGWSNTVETARATAGHWLHLMHEAGMDEVSLLPGEEEHEGRWCFRFRHAVTGAEVCLETHGIDDVDAYEHEHVFTPRTYWRGSSIGEPAIEDFAVPGFRVRRTFAAEASSGVASEPQGPGLKHGI